jgi:hypothetical protein
MKTSLLIATLLIGLFPDSSLAEQGEKPYSFKDAQLGMSLEEFQAQHLTPGSWEDVAHGISSSGTDPHTPPPIQGKWDVKPDWKWKPDMKCSEMVQGTKGVITRCMYQATLLGEAINPTVLFVDRQLAAISFPTSGNAQQVQLAVTEKLGPPVRIPITAHVNPGWFALRWENSVSVVEFQKYHCTSGSDDRDGWSQDVTNVLRGNYCPDEEMMEYGDVFLWYVHKSLAPLAIKRWKEAGDAAEKKARSDI